MPTINFPLLLCTSSPLREQKGGFAQRRRGAEVALAICAMLPTSVLAQSENADEIVVTASGTSQPASEVGQAITIIDAAKLETSQTAVISDILRTVPSVSVARNGGVGAATSIFIRGGDSSQTLVIIDGVRINDPSSPNAAFDFGALLTGNIDRVEVLRGPNSVIWGSQAIGGVVSIQTIEPTSKFGVSARAEYGFSNTAQAQATISGTSGIVSGSLGGGYYRTDGISALAAGTEKDGYENVSANGKLKVALSDDISVNLRGYYNKGKVEFDDQFGATPDTFPFTNNEQYIGYAGLHATLADGKFRNRLSYSRTDISRIGSDIATPQTFNVNSIKATLDRFEYHGSFDIIDAATIIFGAEHERTFASTFFPAGGGAAPDQASTTVSSGFGQVILRPFTGLTLTGGVRYDDYTQYGGQTTFGANFAYTPNDGKTVIRATYAEGFRAPTLTEALLPFGNTALFPETAQSFDIGVQHSFLDGKATASATYFQRDAINLITFSFITFQSENIARARSEGVEFGLSLRPSDTFTVEGSYSLVDAKSRSVGSFGNQLARRPKHNASISADWKTPIGASLGATISLTGDAFDNLANTRRLDGYALASIRASYPISQAIDLFGRVENLFNEKYETASRFGTLGRNAYVGVRAKF